MCFPLLSLLLYLLPKLLFFGFDTHSISKLNSVFYKFTLMRGVDTNICLGTNFCVNPHYQSKLIKTDFKERSCLKFNLQHCSHLYIFILLVCYPVTSLMHAKVDRMSGKPTFDRAFCIRMKSTLTKRGCHFKSSGYRVRANSWCTFRLV